MLVDLLRHGRGACSTPTPVGVPGLWRTTNIFVDLYACAGEGGVLLFDTGMDQRGRPVDRLLAQLDADRADVGHVFLTHAHPDHVAAAALFPGARIYAGAADLDRLRGSEPGKKVSERVLRRLFRTPPVEPTDPLEGPTEVYCDGVRVLALPLPGDTPGAFSYLVRGALLVGDALDLRGGRLQPAHEFATDDPLLNYRSIEGLPSALTEEAVDVIGTAHGGPTMPGEARDLLDQVAARCRERLSGAAWSPSGSQ